ncbi:CoA transferase family III [Saccharothrix saharensis]|uniref:CoA transferase family III n=1 Tax=Saccharothrix saharensis TaxID=571190 RepID=A0A543J546_9PSEU|nr:CoA transferase [Saccharothrix saharensis]TQM77963.1 CoA transferase family III [Saccharothrix saharensis]
MTSTLTAVPWSGPVDLPLGGELDVQAACGLMHVHGRRFGRPTALGLDYASILAAELDAIGAAALDVARLRGVPVRSAATSVAQAALLAVTQYLAAATADEPDPVPTGVGGPPFLSADGVAFEVEALDAEVWRRFWAALDADRGAVARAWRPFQHRFATATCPLPPELTGLTARLPIVRLERVAAATGMTLVPVAHRAIDDVPPYVVRPLGVGTGPVGEGAPRPGALPLSGLVVLESCRRVQGPVAGHLLWQLGATVVRVEPPGGDPLRGVPPLAGDVSARFHALNRGKRVAAVDLATVAGRRELLELVSGADVFLHNWGPGKAAAWSLRARDVARVRPGIVYAHASGWGDALGPRPPLGTDFVVQAHAGVPPSLMTIVDVFGGVVCARGVVDALGGRMRSGLGQSVSSSLLSAAARLNARATRRCTAPLSVPVCTDLAALARDPRFARALVRDRCVVPGPVWEFG